MPESLKLRVAEKDPHPSPLLANVLLDEVDQQLERRGHAFCRYADDCNVYVGSRRAGERVMSFLRQAFGALKLRVNETKSAVGRPWDRKFLGFSFKEARGKKVLRRVSDQAICGLKEKVRDITRRSGGRSMKQVAEELRRYLLGWKAYFGFCEVRTVLHEMDAWIMRKLRILQLKQWKHGPRVYSRLVGRGVDPGLARMVAKYAKRFQWVSRQKFTFKAMPDASFSTLGVPRLAR